MAMLDINEIARRKTERKELLQSSLEDLLPRLERMGAVKVEVFGSLVNGDIRTGSDLDPLVVMPQDRSGREWSRIIYSEIDRVVASDILVSNAVELAEEIETNVFLQQATSKGRPVL